MDQVQQFVEAGVTIPNAIKVALDQRSLSLSAFALKYSIPRPHVGRSIGGGERPTTKLLEALAEELGGTVEQWQLLLYEAGRPNVAVG